MTREKNTCAHPGCTCPPAKNSKYCGTYCEGAKDRIELTCECGHPGCKLAPVKASGPAG